MIRFAHLDMPRELEYEFDLTPSGNEARAIGLSQQSTVHSVKMKFTEDVFMPKSRMDIFDSAEETPIVVSENSSLDTSNTNKLSRLAKVQACEVMNQYYWWHSVEKSLENSPFRSDSMRKPPKNIVQLAMSASDTSGVTHDIEVHNFGDFEMDKDDRDYADDIWTHVAKSTPVSALKLWHDVLMLPSEDISDRSAVVDSDSGILLVTDSIFNAQNTHSTVKVAQGISELMRRKKHVGGDGFSNLEVSYARYTQPWGIRKPELITL